MRYYRRRNYSYKNKDKYSIEQSAANIQIDQTGAKYTIVAPTDLQGMRKVKHLTLNFSCPNTNVPVYYALVYAPSGSTVNSLQIGTTTATSLYEPNQYVMACGVLDFSGGPLRIHCPLSRNLNSGDSIRLVMGYDPDLTQQLTVSTVIRYAVTLQ